MPARSIFWERAKYFARTAERSTAVVETASETLSIAVAFIEADSAYYAFTGDTTEVSMGLSDTLRGIFVIGEGADVINVNLSGNEGVSVAFSATGKSIRNFNLYEKDTNLVNSSDSTIDALLLPQDSTNWTLKVTPTKVVSYLTGPYATFEVASVSRPLEKGEYFANPDSINVPGDTLVVTRPRNDQAKYYLYQEQYIWLADLKKPAALFVAFDDRTRRLIARRFK